MRQAPNKQLQRTLTRPRFTGQRTAAELIASQGSQQSLEGTVNGGWLRAAGAQYFQAPAALDLRFWAAPELHR
jgi:hypothetical protein